MMCRYQRKWIHLFTNAGLLQCCYCKEIFGGQHDCTFQVVHPDCGNQVYPGPCRDKRCANCGSLEHVSDKLIHCEKLV